MKLIKNAVWLALLLAPCGGTLAGPASWEAHMSPDSITSYHGIVLQGNDRLSTPGTFHPPVAISIVAKTDSNNLRLSYAADQVIFNWEVNPTQLRIDGGPADGLHTDGAGAIPAGKFVTIRWVVTPHHQAIYVDNQLRFEHTGDYSDLNRCVSVFPALGSIVTVKSINVEEMALSSERPAPLSSLAQK
jgi:hypothetical protein